MAVAGLCIPVSQAVNGVAGASKSVIAKAAAKSIAKELVVDGIVDFASGAVTNVAKDNFNLNQTESLLLNLGLSFVGEKGADGLLSKSKYFGESSFAEGMSYDDAKRYNDYWRNLESGKNTGYPGLTDADIKAWKLGDAKLDEHIAISKIDPDEVVKLRMKEIELENSLLSGDKGIGRVSKNITNIITENGLTVSKFNELRTRDTSLLTVNEKSTMKAIRDSIPMPDNTTIMQKVIPSSDIDKYLDGTYTQVAGYVTKYDDVSTLSKYDDIYKSLRLDYPGTAYKIDADSHLGVIRFRTSSPEKFEIPYGVDLGGRITDEPPFTGNGFTKAMDGEIIPEYKCNSFIDVYDGGELYQIDKNGIETLIAVFNEIDGKFVPIK